MPYARKRTRKIIKRRRRTYGRRKKSTKTMVRSMIKRALRPHTKVTRLHNNGNAQALSSNFNIFNLTLISTADRVFNTISVDDETRRCKHTSMYLDCLLQTNTETDGVTLTVYIVSPKANTEDTFFDSGSGALSLGSSGTTFSTMAGQAYVNPEYFKIYMRKKLFFPPTGAGDVRNAIKSSKRFTFGIKPGWNIQNTQAGAWGNLVCPQLHHQNVYLLIFNDNSLIDNEWPTCSYTVLNTYVS